MTRTTSPKPRKKILKIIAIAVVILVMPLILSLFWKYATGYFGYLKFANVYLLPGGHPSVTHRETSCILETGYVEPVERQPVEGKKFRYFWQPVSLLERFETLVYSLIQDNDLGHFIQDTSLSDLEKADEIFKTPHPDEYISDSFFNLFPPPRDYQAIGRKQAVCNMIASGHDLIRLEAANGIAWIMGGGTSSQSVLLFDRENGQFLGHLLALEVAGQSPESMLCKSE